MAEPVLGSGARPAGSESVAEFDDIQAIVRFGHGQLPAAAFWLLRIADPAAAREWLGRAPVTSAVSRNPPPDTALQVAFTAEGLRVLGLPDAVMAGFSDEFNAGMAGDESRSRRLGDVGDNAPSRWRWGASGNLPHLLVMLYALPERLADWQREIMGPLWDHAFAPVERLDTALLDGNEPFGFADGVSQPEIDWGRGAVAGELELEYRNTAALGEFLLGYPNEYNRYTDRPLLDPGDGRRDAAAPRRGRPGQTRSRPQRHVPCAARPAAGRPRILGVPRAASRRDRRIGAGPRREHGRPLDARPAAGASQRSAHPRRPVR